MVHFKHESRLIIQEHKEEVSEESLCASHYPQVVLADQWKLRHWDRSRRR